MRPLYIIGPYEEDPEKWTKRLTTITRLVSESDRSHEVVIMCPHPMTYLNGYGDTVNAMTQSLNGLMMAAHFDESELWVVLDSHGGYTIGMEMEIEMWRIWRPPESINEMRYDDWLKHLEDIWHE